MVRIARVDRRVKRTPSSTFFSNVEINVFYAFLADVLLDCEDGRTSGRI